MKEMFKKLAPYLKDGVFVALAVAAVVFVSVYAVKTGSELRPRSAYTPKVAELRPVALMPGQSAMLLKDTTVAARIPYNGDELYVGEVRLEKGTMLVKPKVE